MLALPDYPFHEIAECFPLMEGSEFEALVKDIATNGQREPGWMWQGRIIDGRNRYRASRKAGKPFLFNEWDGNGSLSDFVASLNLHRRHLSESQRAVAAAKLKSRFEAEARGRMTAGKAKDPVANLPQGKARELAALEMNVSPRTVESASKVIREGVPDLVKAVEHGEVAVSAAAEVARLPKPEQQAVVDAGPTAIVKHAAQAREERKHPQQVSAQRVLREAVGPSPDDVQDQAAGVILKYNNTIASVQGSIESLTHDFFKALAGTFQPADRRDAVKELKQLAKTISHWIQILESRHA